MMILYEKMNLVTKLVACSDTLAQSICFQSKHFLCHVKDQYQTLRMVAESLD